MKKVKDFIINIWKKFSSFCMKISKTKSFSTLISSLWCILIALIISTLIMFILSAGNALEGMSIILKNNFVFSSFDLQLKYLGQTIAKTAPLIIISLGIAFAYKSGLFNLGSSGQFTIGVVFVLYAALQLNLNWSLCLIFAILGGMIWGIIPGLLKAFFKVNEVISGILLNSIALYLANFLIPLSPKVWDSSLVRSFYITSEMNGHLPTIGLDKIFIGSPNIGLGVVIAILVAIIFYFVINKTTFGYELKATGLNKDAAKYAGMKEKKNIVLTMLISGGLAGLAAALSYLNGASAFQISANVDQIGFTGISAAFLGGLSPIGIIFSSFFFQHITDGGHMISDLGYSSEVSSLITSIIIYVCGFASLVVTLKKDGKLKFIDKIKMKFKKQDTKEVTE